MSIVYINDKYRINIDNYNHTLEKLTPEHISNRNVGKVKIGDIVKAKWDVVGYYPNVIQCLNKCVDLEITALGELTLSQYLDQLIEIHEKYHRRFK